MLFTLVSRSNLELNVQHDRNPVFVQLSDGGVRNGYTLKVLNKVHATRRFDLRVEGLPGAHLEVIGQVGGIHPQLTAPPDRLRSFRVLVSVPAGGVPDKAAPITFIVKDTQSGDTARHESVFRGPAGR